jgi:MoxR-like ATPase
MLKPVAKAKEVLQAAQAERSVYLSSAANRYVADLSRRTRQTSDIYLGASPRGTIFLSHACQARAALSGRSYVLPDDVKEMAAAVLAHRLIVSPAARLRELSADRIMQEIVRNTPVPGGDFGQAPAGMAPET